MFFFTISLSGLMSDVDVIGVSLVTMADLTAVFLLVRTAAHFLILVYE